MGAAFLLVASLFVHPYWKNDDPTYIYVKVAGLFFIFVCVAGRCWATMYIGGRKNAHLITSGPYSVSRNPLYMFSVVGAFGVGLLSSSFTIGVLFAMATYFLFDVVIRSEERLLQECFPEEFAAYAAATPRWWPRLSRWRESPRIETRPPLVMRTARDGLAFLIPWPIYEVAGEMHERGHMPILAYLP